MRDEKPKEVIGVVADIRTVSLDKQPPLMAYLPYWEPGAPGTMTYLVRTAQDAGAMSNTLRETVRSIDAELPVASMQTMREIMMHSVGRRRFQTLLAGSVRRVCSVARLHGQLLRRDLLHRGPPHQRDGCSAWRWGPIHSGRRHGVASGYATGDRRPSRRSNRRAMGGAIVG